MDAVAASRHPVDTVGPRAVSANRRASLSLSMRIFTSCFIALGTPRVSALETHRYRCEMCIKTGTTQWLINDGLDHYYTFQKRRVARYRKV